MVNKPSSSSAPARYHFPQPAGTQSSTDTTTGLPTIGQSECRSWISSLVPTGSSAVKLLIDGQLYILRDSRLYDVHGRELLSE